MNTTIVSEHDIAQAVKRLQVNAPLEGDVQACAAWCVANYERVQKLRSHMASLTWGIDDEAQLDAELEAGSE
jgi:hypothetical protein